jgi:hypothetical protein
MLGLGKKSPPSLDRFPTDNWTVAQGVADGKPMIVRINAGAKKYVGHPELAAFLGVTVAFRSPNEHGFPSKDETPELDAIEARFDKDLEATRLAFPALVITTGGKREFVYYVLEREKPAAAVDAIRAQSPSHQITYGFVDDPTWSYYGQFA